MKRIGAIACLVVFMLSMTMSIAMAAGELKVDEVYPKDGAKDMSMDNMGFKIYLSENVYKNKKANSKLCHIVDSKGKEVPSIVVCNPKEKNVMMVLADTNNKKTKIKGKMKYTVTIDKGFKADSGAVLADGFKSSFTTLNPSTSMWISMGMMGVMVIGMVFFTMREAKKKEETAEPDKKERAVNPYKEAKRTGKSVEEIVAAEDKKKAKKEAKRERQKRENKVEIATDNIKVKSRAPISAVGLKYKDPKQQHKQKTKEQAMQEKQAAQGKKKNQNKKKKK
jgi:hypothetical protein